RAARPMVPASAASSTSCLSLNAVRTRTAASPSSVIWRAAAIPSIFGIFRSMTTRSGWRSRPRSPAPRRLTVAGLPADRVAAFLEALDDVGADQDLVLGDDQARHVLSSTPDRSVADSGGVRDAAWRRRPPREEARGTALGSGRGA